MAITDAIKELETSLRESEVEMTLDEAIAYHERIANIEEQACFIISKEDGDYEMHRKSALHHKMLVKWLTELKRYRDQRGISIDDFEDAMSELQNEVIRKEVF